MTPLSLVLAALAYGAFYAAAPGRQSQALGPTRPLLAAGAVLTVVAFVLSYLGTGTGAGPALVITVMMAMASLLAVTGPFLLPEAEKATPRRSGAPPPAGAMQPGSAIQPGGARPPGTPRLPGLPPSAKPVAGPPPGRPPSRPPSSDSAPSD
ncbi:MAG: hypothetical protein AAGG50_21195 [Bacteroidota bacterium]